MHVIRNEHAADHISLFGVLAIAKTRSDVDVHCEWDRGRPGWTSVIQLDPVPRSAADNAGFIRRGCNIQLDVPQVVAIGPGGPDS